MGSLLHPAVLWLPEDAALIPATGPLHLLLLTLLGMPTVLSSLSFSDYVELHFLLEAFLDRLIQTRFSVPPVYLLRFFSDII